MSNELIHTIGRLRRAMPRNSDVMAVCDSLEEKLAQKVAVIEAKVEGFDRRTYQRELMRKRRAKAKTE